MRFILRFKRKLKKATNANKIIINKREARDDAKEVRETKVEARKIEANTRANARVDAKVNERAITTTTTTTIIINRKQLSRLRKQFACTYISFVLETTLILLSCLLLFNNSRECVSNALYS